MNALSSRPQFNPYSNYYNPGYAQNPRLSYGAHNQNYLQPPPRNSNNPPGFNPRPSQQSQYGQSRLPYNQGTNPFQQGHNRFPQGNNQFHQSNNPYQQHNNQFSSNNPYQHSQNQQHQFQHPPQKSNLEQMMENFVVNQNQFISCQGKKNDELSNSVIQLSSSQKMMETQLAQLAQQLSNTTKASGTFPGNTKPNPKGHINAIHLRSGRVLDEVVAPTKKSKGVMGDVNETVNEAPPPVRNMDEVVIDIVDDSNVAKAQPPPSPRAYVPPVPFPQRLAKAKLEQKYGKFLEILKNMHINIPFIDVISEIPSYGKFLKELISSKKKLGATSTINLTQECSAILLNKLPPKLDDPGSFSIPCSIDNVSIQRALYDLGTSVSIMPISVFKRLPNVDLRPTRVSLQLADRSVKLPLGIVEDMPLAVGKLVVPCDFFVMDIPEDSNFSIILGRPCLATVGAIIDVKSGKLSLQVGDEKVEFELNKTMGGPSMSDTCSSVDVLEDYLTEPSLEATSSNLQQECVLDDPSDDMEMFSYAWMLDSPSHEEPI
ncbi:hypothetical protein RND81_06G082000 [Saponaria officinalis]|uniref:Aspartic peptidase DDI1-type domain-containing protein n=1 Tax=Saponaria officinalis TaxID=3572 RepID=A0AAW1K4F0_SAPOF